MKNIVLVGFMGTGKTAVAKALSRRLGMRYVSTDEVIEKKAKRTIAEIFSTDGEEYFRRLETDAVRQASGLQDAVIDAGGGVVIKEENVGLLKKSGAIICLTASVDVILERTKGKQHRPLLNVRDPGKKIEELLKSRASYYAKADFAIDTSYLTVDDVVKKIIDIVNP
jgi:shikimate kinase